MSSHIAPQPAIRYLGVTLDCPDPAELAHVYSEALGLPITLSTDDFVFLSREGSPGLGFYRLDDYQPPTWPDAPAEVPASATCRAVRPAVRVTRAARRSGAHRHRTTPRAPVHP